MLRMCCLSWRHLVLLSVATPLSAFAQDALDIHPLLTSKYNAHLGVFFPERSFKISVDASVPIIESSIDISEQFKLGSSESTESIEIGWRFGKKWLLRGQYFAVGGSRSATLGEDVVWGDYTFGADTGIFGGIDVAITRMYFGYTFDSSDHHEFGIGGGLHLLDISAFIRGQAIINNNPPEVVEASVSTSGPLPNIGGWYVRSLSSRWAVTTRLDWLSASVGDYDGTIINAAAGLNLAVTRNFGVGLSYNYFGLDIGVKDTNWRGTVEQRIAGPFLYLTANW